MCLKRLPKGEQRTIEQITEHYKIEKELANKLINADKEDRKKLYKTVYDELYSRVPFHPQLTQKTSLRAQRKSVASQMKLLSGFLNRESVFLEIGPGDCQLSFEIARYVKKVYAVDVSEKITGNLHRPENFELILSGDINRDIFNKNISIAYSNQLIEHIYPDDVFDQLQGIYNALVPGGVYICITPHRFAGPHDVSAYFDDVATGFHLKEYTNRELHNLFKAAGFSKIESFLNLGMAYIKFPIYPVMMVEYLLSFFPRAVRKRISRMLLFRSILGIRIAAVKQELSGNRIKQ